MEHIHEHEHCHEHTHGGVTHTHAHAHEHEHTHDHGRAPEGAARTKALLAYMIDHNEHHNGELTALLGGVDGAAKEKLSEAIGGFAAANAQLREVLALLEE